MVRDLDQGVEIVTCPTVRESDGLALSSRNRRLTAEGTCDCEQIPASLDRANLMFQGGETDAMALITAFSEDLLAYPGVDIDYAQVMSIDGFKEVEDAGPGCLAVAVFIDGVRMIDHCLLGGPLICTVEEDALKQDGEGRCLCWDEPATA